MPSYKLIYKFSEPGGMGGWGWGWGVVDRDKVMCHLQSTESWPNNASSRTDLGLAKLSS